MRGHFIEKCHWFNSPPHNNALILCTDNVCKLLSPYVGICIAEKESEFNSQAVGFNGNSNLGLFQISDRWWCKWNQKDVNFGCGIKCEQLLDQNLIDDIKCVKKIFKETLRLTGNGFNAWYVTLTH